MFENLTSYMDCIFHSLLGLTISKQFIGQYLPLAFLFSALPDLIGTIPYEIQKFKHSSKKSVKDFLNDWLKFPKRNQFFDNWDKYPYRLTHNMFAWIFVTLIAWIIFSDVFIILSICYLSHLIVDIFTHQDEFATRLFYPTSDFHIQGSSWDINVKLFLISWVLLLICMIFQHFLLL